MRSFLVYDFFPHEIDERERIILMVISGKYCFARLLNEQKNQCERLLDVKWMERAVKVTWGV